MGFWQKFFLTATMGAASLMPLKVAGADDFHYFVEPRDATHINRPQRRGLEKESIFRGVRSIGEHSEVDSSNIPKDLERILIHINPPLNPSATPRERAGQEEGFLDIGYRFFDWAKLKRRDNLGEFEGVDTGRIFFAESPHNTKIFVVTPQEVSIGGGYQVVAVYTHQRRFSLTNVIGFRFAMPYEETDLGRASRGLIRRLEDFNNSLEPFFGKDFMQEAEGFERELDLAVKALPQALEVPAEAIVKGSKWYLRWLERRMRREIEEKYPGYNVTLLPFYVENGSVRNFMDHTRVGRVIRLGVDSSRLKEEKKGYVVIPKICAERRRDGEDEMIDLDNLEYEFPIFPNDRAPGLSDVEDDDRRGEGITKISDYYGLYIANKYQLIDVGSGRALRSIEWGERDKTRYCGIWVSEGGIKYLTDKIEEPPKSLDPFLDSKLRGSSAVFFTENSVHEIDDLGNRRFRISHKVRNEGPDCLRKVYHARRTPLEEAFSSRDD